MAQSTNSKKTTSQTKAAGADTKKRTTSTKQKTPTREEQYRGKHFNGSPKLPAARVREIYLYISFALNVLARAVNPAAVVKSVNSASFASASFVNVGI